MIPAHIRMQEIKKTRLQVSEKEKEGVRVRDQKYGKTVNNALMGIQK